MNKFKQIIAILRAPMTGAAIQITLDSLSNPLIADWLNENQEAESYFNEGDYLMYIEDQDCMTIVPKDEFEKKFHFTESKKLDDLVPCESNRSSLLI